MANKQRGSTSELERDSSLSDTSSGYFSAIAQTEYEEAKFHTRAAKTMISGPPVLPTPGTYAGVSPMFIMNNVLHQQPNSVTPSLNSSLEIVPQSSLVFFQPVVPSGSCSYQSSTQLRQSKNDIMTSFASIAPHPAHRGHKHSSSHSRGRRRRQRHQKKSVRISLNQDTSETTTAGNSSVDPQISMHNMGNVNSENSFPFSFTKCSEAAFTASNEAENFLETLSPNTSKRKRFCNTYNILNQSGLLGITLRTKELIQQNKCSQDQLRKLQAHTDLFLEAVSSRDPQVWTKLQLMLQNNTDEANTIYCI